MGLSHDALEALSPRILLSLLMPKLEKLSVGVAGFALYFYFQRRVAW